jgi:hypothetical protein
MLHESSRKWAPESNRVILLFFLILFLKKMVRTLWVRAGCARSACQVWWLPCAVGTIRSGGVTTARAVVSATFLAVLTARVHCSLRLVGAVMSMHCVGLPCRVSVLAADEDCVGPRAPGAIKIIFPPPHVHASVLDRRPPPRGTAVQLSSHVVLPAVHLVLFICLRHADG